MPIKGENIYKRKDRRWEGRYIRERNQDGSIRYGYCYARTYREVRTKLLELKTCAAEQLPLSKTDRHALLSDYCDEWLRFRRVSIKESTYVKYYGVIERYIKPRLGAVPVCNLSALTIEEFTRSLLFGDQLSPKTARDITTVLHGILKYAQQQRPDMPGIRLVYPHNPQKEMRVLSREEQSRLVNELNRNCDLCSFGILLCLLTGMRIGEVCALRWRDISMEDGLLRISATMQRIKNFDAKDDRKTKIIITAPKSNSGHRVIPLTKQAIGLCRKMYCSDPECFVLTGRRDQLVEPRTLQNRFQKIVNACGLEGVHFHTLRHTFATRCIEADFEIKTLSEIMGHASPRITLERYAHASMELKRVNMNKLSVEGL